jgi:hypothetical protein
LIVQLFIRFLLANRQVTAVICAVQPKTHMMKKYITTLFALALAIGSIGFVGCGGDPDPDPKAQEEGESTPPDPDGSGENDPDGE